MRFVALKIWPRRLASLLLLVFFGFSNFAAFAGWWITETKSDRFGNNATQNIFIEEQKLRFEKASSTFIFDLQKNEVTLIFPTKTVYWQGQADSLRATFIQTIQQQLQMMLGQMPEYEREKAQPEIDKLFAEMRDDTIDTAVLAKFSMRQTDSVSEINGLKAAKYQLFYDTAMIESVWISKEVAPYQAISFDHLNKMMRLFSRPTLYSSARMSDAWRLAVEQGLLMQSVVETSFGPNVMEVSQVKELKIRDDFFDPPSTYRQIQSTEAVQIMLGEAEKSSVLHGKPEDEIWKPILPKPVKNPKKNPSIQNWSDDERP